jgi:hypothetical protein
MMIWVLTLRRWLLLLAVMVWWCTGIGVASMIHGWLLSSASGPSVGTRREMMRSTADWLVPNGAARARVVTFVRRSMSTSGKPVRSPVVPMADRRAVVGGGGSGCRRCGSGRR